MFRILTLIVLLTFSSFTLACDPMPPAQAWIDAQDTNNDGKLDFNEWLKTKNNPRTDAFKLRFTAGDAATFRRLDKNHDGFLSWEKDDIGKDIDYIKNPCAGWPFGY